MFVVDLRIWLFSQQFSNKLFNKPTEKMKKVFALMSIVAMFSMVACGPSNQEAEEAEKKRIQDSTNAADSAAAAQKALEDAMTAPVDTVVVDSMAPAEGTNHEGH
jgi:uncharacterized membrane protein YebE (DUF533 family)